MWGGSTPAYVNAFLIHSLEDFYGMSLDFHFIIKGKKCMQISWKAYYKQTFCTWEFLSKFYKLRL